MEYKIVEYTSENVYIASIQKEQKAENACNSSFKSWSTP